MRIQFVFDGTGGPFRNTKNRVVFYVVYDRPRDYPTNFVLRKQSVDQNGKIEIDPHCFLGSSLEEIRNVIPDDLVRIARSSDDDPSIVETWI